MKLHELSPAPGSVSERKRVAEATVQVTAKQPEKVTRDRMPVQAAA